MQNAGTWEREREGQRDNIIEYKIELLAAMM